MKSVRIIHKCSLINTFNTKVLNGELLISLKSFS
ncbi:hypothetical protein GMA8713_03076 [Grimontia marina]|uniref:Uncharacterized protein n=1 Tax=Grimontia marina TaxID=646534 RepID=A0A128FC85_9GAMM|nr:hypothetical protein GMA8713_03076 [Grimontia marina]